MKDGDKLSFAPSPGVWATRQLSAPLNIHECTDEDSVATAALLSEAWPAAKSPSQLPGHKASGNQELSDGV